MLLHLAEHIAIALQNAEVYREAEQQMKFYFNSGFFVSGGLLQLCTSRPSTAAIVPRACSTPSRACHRSHGHFEGARSPHIGGLPQDLGPQSLLLMVTMHAPPGGFCRLEHNMEQLRVWSKRATQEQSVQCTEAGDSTEPQTAELCGVTRCSVFLLDEAAQQLWSVSTDTGAEIRIPKDKGTAALRRDTSASC